MPLMLLTTLVNHKYHHHQVPKSIHIHIKPTIAAGSLHNLDDLQIQITETNVNTEQINSPYPYAPFPVKWIGPIPIHNIGIPNISQPSLFHMANSTYKTRPLAQSIHSHMSSCRSESSHSNNEYNVIDKLILQCNENIKAMQSAIFDNKQFVHETDDVYCF